MNRLTIRIFSLFVGVVLLALILMQLYWVSNTIKLTEKRFDQDVVEALNDVVYNTEKTFAARSTQKFNFSKQAMMWISGQDTLHGRAHIESDTMGERKGYRVKNTNYNLRVLERLTTDSNGVETGRISNSYFTNDTLPKGDLGLGVKFEGKNSDSLDRKLQWLYNHTDVMNSIFDEFVSINVYHDFNPHLDTAQIDSLVHRALAEKNIHLSFRFGILNASSDTVLIYSHPGKEGVWSKEETENLLQSPYKVNLSPKNVFIPSRYLSLWFPTQTHYTFSRLQLILVSSIALILLLIGAFYYTISTIFRQKKLSEIKNDFINNMTHEFKTPISTIGLAGEVLSDKTIVKSRETEEKYIQIIKNENKRLAGLVEKVLQAAVLDKDKLEFKIEECDVHQIIQDVIQSLSLQIQSKGGKVFTDLKAQRYSLFADHTHLGNIIYNLIDNALKYSKDFPVINISTMSDNEGIYIHVKDNGIGIRKEDQKKVFETFYRVPTGNVHNVKGFGLGLSYVKAVVEKHKGRVEVQSEPGAGSVFTVYLPFNNS